MKDTKGVKIYQVYKIFNVASNQLKYTIYDLNTNSKFDVFVFDKNEDMKSYVPGPVVDKASGGFLADDKFNPTKI